MAIRSVRMAIGMVVVAAAMSLTGCSGGSGSASPASTHPTSAQPPSTVAAEAGVPAPAGSASPYPVAASGSPSPLPVIGSRSNGVWTFVLNAVRQAGPGQLLVEGTVTSHGGPGLLFHGFEEPGHDIRKDEKGNFVSSTFEFSAVSIMAPGDTTVYLPLRDSASRCACTQGLLSTTPEQPYAVYTLMTAPASAGIVTVVVQGFAPFTNVSVTS